MMDDNLGIDQSIAVTDYSRILGSLGEETVQVAGVVNVSVDQNIERVELNGSLANYSFLQQGNQLLIIQASAAVATVTIQEDSGGTTLVFKDGAAKTLFGTTGVMQLGGQSLNGQTATSFTVSQLGTSFNANDVASFSTTVLSSMITLVGVEAVAPVV